MIEQIFSSRFFDLQFDLFASVFLWFVFCFSLEIVHPVINVRNQLVGSPFGKDVTIECNVEASPRSINYWIKDVKDGKFFVFRFVLHSMHVDIVDSCNLFSCSSPEKANKKMANEKIFNSSEHFKAWLQHTIDNFVIQFHDRTTSCWTTNFSFNPHYFLSMWENREKLYFLLRK